MSTISLHTQNFHTSASGSPFPVSAAGDNGLAKISPGLDRLSGSTALSTGNPGFGARSTGRFNIGDFLG